MRIVTTKFKISKFLEEHMSAKYELVSLRNVRRTNGSPGLRLSGQAGKGRGYRAARSWDRRGVAVGEKRGARHSRPTRLASVSLWQSPGKAVQRRVGSRKPSKCVSQISIQTNPFAKFTRVPYMLFRCIPNSVIYSTLLKYFLKLWKSTCIYLLKHRFRSAWVPWCFEHIEHSFMKGEWGDTNEKIYIERVWLENNYWPFCATDVCRQHFVKKSFKGALTGENTSIKDRYTKKQLASRNFLQLIGKIFYLLFLF